MRSIRVIFLITLLILNGCQDSRHKSSPDSGYSDSFSPEDAEGDLQKTKVNTDSSIIKATSSTLGLGFGGMFISAHIDNLGSTWLGVDVAGVVRSDDQGKTWQILSRGIRHIYTSVILVHPEKSNVVFIGTRGGVHKSIDRGKTWLLN